MAASYRRLVSYVIPLLVSLSLGVVATHQVRQIALSDQDNVDTFYSLTDGLETYKQEMRQEWRTRILSTLLAGLTVKSVEHVFHPRDRNAAMRQIARVWAFVWLLATFLVFVIVARERSLLYIFGIFGGIAFAYTPGIGVIRFYPWDLPALFSFACFVAVLMLHRLHWLVVLVPLATLLKETALLLPLAGLFWERVAMRRRLMVVGVTFLAAVSLKSVVDLITENPSPLVTMTLRDGTLPFRFGDNLQRIAHIRDWTTHPVFVNAGLLVALFLLPVSDRRILMLKVIAALFVLGNLLFASIVEYRVWFELLPLSLYAIDLHFSPATATRSGATPALAPPGGR